MFCKNGVNHFGAPWYSREASLEFTIRYLTTTHDEYDSTTRQSENYTIAEVKAYRSQLYEVIERISQQALEKYLSELPDLQKERSSVKKIHPTRILNFSSNESLNVLILNEDEPVAKLLSIIAKQILPNASVEILQNIDKETLSTLVITRPITMIIIHESISFSKSNHIIDILMALADKSTGTLRVVTTAYITSNHIKDLFENQADEVLIKPFDISEVERILRKFFRLR